MNKGHILYFLNLFCGSQEIEGMDINQEGKFIIYSPARSGSHFLQSLLSSHPDIQCHDEINSYIEDLEDPIECITRLLDILDQSLKSCKMAGFIVHDTDIRNAKRENNKLINMIHRIEFDKWPVIWLNRDNWLKRYISYEMASSTGIFNTTREVDHNMRISISSQELKETFRSWKTQKNMAQLDFYRNPKIEVVYENILVGKGIDAILDFLGVQPCKLKTDLKKIVKRTSREIIRDYSILKMEMALTEWVRYFDE